jgi:hypothetical protein
MERIVSGTAGREQWKISMGSAFPSPDTTLGGDIIDGMILIIAPFLPTIVLLAMVFMVLNKRKKKELAAKK